MTSKKLGAIALALALSLAVVGCGSSKKNDEASNTEAAGQAEKQSDGSSTTTTEKPGDDSSSSDLSDALSDLGSGQVGDCLSTSLAYASLVLAPLGFTGGATQEQIDKFEQDTQDLEAKIPSELKDDFETVASAYKEYGETLKGIDFADMLNPDTQQKLEDASENLDDPDVKAAQDRITAYFDENCGG